jgi:hypothetical protein
MTDYISYIYLKVFIDHNTIYQYIYVLYYNTLCIFIIQCSNVAEYSSDSENGQHRYSLLMENGMWDQSAV